MKARLTGLELGDPTDYIQGFAEQRRFVTRVYATKSVYVRRSKAGVRQGFRLGRLL